MYLPLLFVPGETAESTDGAANSNDDREAIAGGLAFTVAGVTLAGSYGDVKNDGYGNEADYYDATLAYGIGDFGVIFIF